MATMEELQAQLAAMQEKLDALTAPPADYYTSRYSGEELDNALSRVVSGVVSSFNGRGGAVVPAAGDYTAAMVGAAPGGYGFGEPTVYIRATGTEEAYEAYCARLDAILEGLPDNTGKLIRFYPPQIYGSGAQMGILFKFGSLYASIRSLDNYDTNFFGLSMRKIKGVWQPLEWIDPPLKLGIEYRTTERYLGKPVYVKLVNCGAGPAAGAEVSVAHGIPNMGYIVDFCGVLTDTGGQALGLPYYINAGNQGYLRVNYLNIVIKSVGTNLAGYNDTKVWIKYTKTTD